MSELKVLTFPGAQPGNGTFADQLRAMARAIDDGTLPEPKNGVVVLEGAMSGQVSCYAIGSPDPVRGIGLLNAAATVLLWTVLRTTESI